MMTRLVTVEEIEEHLKHLGAGNHADNMKQVKLFSRHYLLTLTELEFMSLVFLQSSEVSKIVPTRSDRRLKAVAQRASKLSKAEAHLNSNWDLTKIRSRSAEVSVSDTGFQLPALLLREVRGSEAEWVPNGWYLQDGAHRALGYSMMILLLSTSNRILCYRSNHRRDALNYGLLVGAG